MSRLDLRKIPLAAEGGIFRGPKSRGDQKKRQGGLLGGCFIHGVKGSGHGGRLMKIGDCWTWK